MGGGADHAIHAAPVKGLDDLHLTFGIVVRNTEQQADVIGLRHFFDAAHDAPDKGVGDGGDDQADRVGALAFQALRHGVGRVAHLLRQLLDALAHLGLISELLWSARETVECETPAAVGNVLDRDRAAAK